jgi:hypothetical protein
MSDEAGVMLAEQRGPSSRQTQEVAKDKEIGIDPRTSRKRSEATDGVTGES